MLWEALRRHGAARRPACAFGPFVLSLTLLLAGGLRPVQAQAKAYFAQDRLVLNTQPQTLSLLVQDQASFQSVLLTLRYDAEAMVITAADLGALVKAVRPEASLTVAASRPGELSLRADFDVADKADEADDSSNADDPSATGEADDAAVGDDRNTTGSEQAASSVPLPLPQGSGELFSLTLAPLAKSEAPVELVVVELKLLGPGGEESPEVAPLTLTVDQDPDEASKQAYLEQAATLKPSSPWSGLLDGGWLPGLPKAVSPELAWLSLAMGGAALAALAWVIGRRPPPLQDDAY